MDAFGNREIAVGFWLIAFVVGALCIRDVRSAVPGILRSLVAWKVGGSFLALAGYVALTVWGASKVGLWTNALWLETTYWYFAAAIPFFVNAVTGTRHVFRKTLRDVFAFTFILEFIVNFHSFHLAAELLLVPLITVIAMTALVAEQKDDTRSVARLLEGVLAVAGFWLFAYSLHTFSETWGILDRADAARRFALPFWMTLAVVPFVYVAKLMGVYETAFMRIGFHAKTRRARWRAKGAILGRLHMRAHAVERVAGQALLDICHANSFREAWRVSGHAGRRPSEGS